MKNNNEIMNQYEKRFYKFYKLLVEQQLLIEQEKLLIEQEKLLGEIEEPKKKRIILYIKKRRSNDSTVEKNSKSIKELYKEA